ncbi:FAD-dependent oxidoreductase [Actinokineospora sp.]|uniref:FAD-dependent oxidoreductase n=1 Tax=Actinokineospora sp. TaxID=1872133 RepID=UPI00403791D5
MTKPVLVAGAGIGGLTAALAMSRHGIPVRVFERRTLAEITASAGFGHTIWSNATTSLATLGLAQGLRDAGEYLRASESRNSRQEVMFRMEMAKSMSPGAMPAMGIGRADLIGLLREACLSRGVDIRHGCAIHRFDPTEGGVTLKVGDGETVTGAGLIGADGVRSTVHTQVHGGLPLLDTGRSTYRGIATGTCGLSGGVVHLFSDPASRIGGGAWLIGGDRVVWTLSCERAPDGEDPQGTWARAMEMAELLGEIPRTFVSRTPPERTTRTHVFHHDWLDYWGHGPVTLLGDAAHALPTDLGQGACQAIEDGVVLGDALACAQDVASGLRAYERRRRPRVAWIRQQVLRVNGFKPIANPAARWLVTKIAKVVIAASAPKMWREIQRPPELSAEPAVAA